MFTAFTAQVLRQEWCGQGAWRGRQPENPLEQRQVEDLALLFSQPRCQSSRSTSGCGALLLLPYY